MRDSNYRAVLSNRAAITITNTIYDRRALDVSADKPLINSLNYLTCLASSLQKVRETLAVDGGIERLVDILHECHNTCCTTDNSVVNAEKKILTAWKWTLALQCLVLVGTRGTDAIRERMVDAGILPTLATILDNFLFLNDSSRLGHSSYPFHPSHSAPTVDPTIESRRANPNAFVLQESLVNPFRNFDDDHVATVAPLPTQSTQQGEDATRNPFAPDIGFNTNPSSELWQAHANRWEPHSDSFDPELLSNSQASSSSTISGEGDFSADMARQILSRPDSMEEKHSETELVMDDFENLSTEQLFRLARDIHGHRSVLGVTPSCGDACHPLSRGIRQRLVAHHILERLKLEKQTEKSFDAQDAQFYQSNMDTNLHFLKDHTITGRQGAGVDADNDSHRLSVRSFTPLGVVVPHEDDVIWALQLLAYISKQPAMKQKLQCTNLVVDMSIRDKHVMRMVDVAKRGNELAPAQQKWNPAALHQTKPLAMPSVLEFYVRGLSMDNQQHAGPLAEYSRDHNLESEFDHVCTRLQCRYCEARSNGSGVRGFNRGHGHAYFVPDQPSSTQCSGYSHEIREKILATKSLATAMERDIALYHLQDNMEAAIASEAKELTRAIRSKHRNQRQFLSQKWDYENYDGFRIDGGNQDQDEALIVHKTVNLFPLVEKFTFLTGTVIYNWAGVIMRNSCRRCESRGSVRQCGNTECGKWESYPREFPKCRRCKRTKYCSRECQTKAWVCHRNWCVQSTSSATATNTTVTTNNTTNHAFSTNSVAAITADRTS